MSFASIQADSVKDTKGFKDVSGHLLAKGVHPHNLPHEVQFPPLVKEKLHDDIYATLFNTLDPQVLELTLAFSRITDEATYEVFYNLCLGVANMVSPGGRIVFAESDGTVVVDTGVPTDFTNVNPNHANSYAHWHAKNVNENHNTRTAFEQANGYPAGISLESKFSSSVQQNSIYVAIRGRTRPTDAKHPNQTYLDSSAKGVFRISIQQL